MRTHFARGSRSSHQELKGARSANRSARTALLVAVTLCAVAPICSPARADGPQADRVVADARDAAQHDRNAESAALFQRAIALDPSRRKEWVRELADQLNYSGHAEQAISLFQEVLAAHPPLFEERQARLGLALAFHWSHHQHRSLREYTAWLDRFPGDLKARLGRAEVLAWMDRHQAATREYKAVLQQDPGNVEALRGLGQMQSWSGHLRGAARQLAAVLHDHPEDAQGKYLLAQSQAWLGRPDQARHTLAGLLAQHPGNKEALRLMGELDQQEQPDSAVDYQSSTQSDHLTIGVESLQQNLHLNGGRTTIGARYQQYRYDPGQGQTPILDNRPGIYVRHRFSDQTELTTNLFTDRIMAQGGGQSRTLLTYDSYVTLWPNDTLRFDIGTNRTTFDNVKSLTRGITATSGTFSMDVTPDEKTRFTTRANWGAYSDGNARKWLQLETERRLRTHPNLLFGMRYTTFGFSRMLDNGYFNPSSYQSLVGTGHLYGHSGSRLSYDLNGAWGREHSNPGGGKPFSSAGASLTYRAGPRMEVQGSYQFFSSRQASSSGFARSTIGLFVRYQN